MEEDIKCMLLSGYPLNSNAFLHALTTLNSINRYTNNQILIVRQRELKVLKLFCQVDKRLSN